MKIEETPRVGESFLEISFLSHFQKFVKKCETDNKESQTDGSREGRTVELNEVAWDSAVQNTGKSIADEVKEVAENALKHTSFVYEPTSGMYYDYSTGYYYNAVGRSNYTYK